MKFLLLFLISATLLVIRPCLADTVGISSIREGDSLVVVESWEGLSHPGKRKAAHRYTFTKDRVTIVRPDLTGATLQLTPEESAQLDDHIENIRRTPKSSGPATTYTVLHLRGQRVLDTWSVRPGKLRGGEQELTLQDLTKRIPLKQPVTPAPAPAK